MSSFDWSKCIFCQREIAKVRTVCPSDSKRTDVGCGYASLATAVRGFSEIGELPSGINVEAWDEGDGIEATCRRRRACWHASCRQVLHGTKLDRLRLRAQVQVVSAVDIDSTQKASETSIDCDVPCKLPRITRRPSFVPNVKHVDTLTCFFCDKPGDDLRQVMTFQLDQRVRKCTSVTGDSELLGKLVAGDMIATEAKYHPGCLLSLYRRASLMQSSGSEDTDASGITVPNSESLALAVVIAYIEDTNCNGETPSVFKLSELGNFYTELLQKHGVNLHAKLNISRFKDRLLAACPDCCSTW